MKNKLDCKLDHMVRSLEEHIDLAKKLKLDFVAQLLAMTAMEVKINKHRISEQEIYTLCTAAVSAPTEPFPAPDNPDQKQGAAHVIRFPRGGRFVR